MTSTASPPLGDALAQMDRSRALDAQRFGEDLAAQLDRGRPSAEDKLQRAFRRIEAGTFTQPAYDPHGPRADACGPVDDFGRCGAAFHVQGCHQTVEASAATGDADAAHAWREVMLGYTPPPEVLGYTAELASPLDEGLLRAVMTARKSPSPSAAPPAEPVPEPARPAATASNETPPLPAWEPAGTPPDDLVTVFVTNGVRTSDGPGPGVKHVTPAEARALFADRLAVAGDQPPRGYG